MTKFIKHIALTITIIVFANTVSANKWPIFSTNPANPTDIKLDRIFDSNTQVSDENYTYKLDLNEPNLQLMNILIAVAPTSEGKLVPNEAESEKDKMTYSIHLNNEIIAKIDITRKN